MIFQFFAIIIFIKFSKLVLTKLLETKSIPNLNETFPLELKNKMIFKILIGVAVFLIYGLLEPFLSDKISMILKNYFNIFITKEQNVVSLMKGNGLIAIIF